MRLQSYFKAANEVFQIVYESKKPHRKWCNSTQHYNLLKSKSVHNTGLMAAHILKVNDLVLLFHFIWPWKCANIDVQFWGLGKKNGLFSLSEWQDPEFMREIEAATGVDLGSSRYSGKGKGGKSKGKKKKYPNLTDLKQQANTSRSRLGKKVFNK